MLMIQTKLLLRNSAFLSLLVVCPGANSFAGFAPYAAYDVGLGANTIAVGDFNGDGMLDLATSNWGFPGQQSTVSVLLGNGDGTFAPRQDHPAGTEPSFVVAGDFTGDGILDLAVSNWPTGTLSILDGLGDGTFGAPKGAFPTAVGGIRSVVVADFDRDGILDLAAAGGESSDSLSQVSVLLGTGGGQFSSAQVYNAGRHRPSIAFGDFNGDGVPDLAVASTYDPIELLLGNGDGSFARTRHTSGIGSQTIVAGDFDGDQILDLIVSNVNGISVHAGVGNGTFLEPSSHIGFLASSLACGHFDQSGTLDLAGGVQAGSPSAVSVYMRDGRGESSHLLLPVVGGVHATVVGDFNGDGLEDIAVSCWNEICVLINTFAPPPPPCADVTGDGVVSFPDISAVLSYWGTNSEFGDGNHDGFVDFGDINAVLAQWLQECP